MTHLLPANLLKLFAPRPPLPYIRPLPKSNPQTASGIKDSTIKRHLTGVAAILEQIREENAVNVIASGKGKAGANAPADGTGEEGEEVELVDEEDKFTYVEEVKRQIFREEKKKKKVDEFNSAKENCEYSSGVRLQFLLLRHVSIGPTSGFCSVPDLGCGSSLLR